MNGTNHPNGADSGASESEHLLKTDVFGRARMFRSQREAILDLFESNGMTGKAFALQHGIKILTFASWMQKTATRRPTTRMTLGASQDAYSGSPEWLDRIHFPSWIALEKFPAPWLFIIGSL